MKKKRPSQSGFFNPRVLLGLVLGSLGVLLALVGIGMSSGTAALAQDSKRNQERGGTPQTTAGVKIAPEVLAETADGKNASVVIFLADQADVSAAYDMQDQDARGWYVYNTLTQHAARTQAGLQAFLTAQGVSYQSFWAANMIVATADRALVEALGARVDVARIDSNKPARWIEDPEVANFEVTPASPDVVNTVEWGVLNVRAPSVWAMGFTGQGMVVGDLDTGERWTHNALKPKYRGWNGVTADHNFNWHDAIHSGGGICGADTQEPCDDSGHGTHTAGTTVGDDGLGNQVGVAPGAKWIGCRNMDQGNGMPSTYTECFQFMIAPTDLAGNNANPALRPHVLNNSWGCPASEGCVTRAELETIVNNTQAAGIFVEVSAGNSGSSGCSSVTDAPAIYSASFSTGAITINNVLSSFSSRGPSTFYTPNLLKPNISAPGSNVRSTYSTSDSSYTNLSGTSMAGPHVCGVVALLWSARPELVRDIAATKSVLQNSANPNVTLTPVQTCGGIPSTQIPNNSFGYGRVDALVAVNFGSPTPTPTATATSTPTATATVTVAPSPTPTGTPPGGTPSPTPPGVTPSPTPPTATPTPTPAAQTINLSTRMRVQTGDNVGIGGFIITGTVPKHVLLRAIGPSLSQFGVPNVLADPVMELHGPGGFVTIVNDNWMDDPVQKAAIMATGIPPSNSLESAIDANLVPGAYTAIVSGKNNTSGVALVEVYDLSQAVGGKLANISTRAFVSTGDNIVIAGFILGNNSGDDTIVVRGLGGPPPTLADPRLELRDANGVLIGSNNDWQDDPAQAAQLIALGLGPLSNLDAAIVATLPPGLYTALLSGRNNGTGVGLVEVYDLGNVGGGTPSPTPTPGGTPTPSPTGTPAGSPSATPIGSPSATPMGSPSPTPTPSPSPSPSPSPQPCMENFDGVTAPALPAGWTATNASGDTDMWVTSTISPDTAPNDAFIPDQDGISDKYLDSRDIIVSSATATLSFRNNFDTEFSGGTYWDGYVLEVSSPNINGGAFTDVTDPTVGGSIPTGGYTGEIDGTANNPLAGRMAWSGPSGGYINTVVNLGPNVNGQTIKLRFRMGTDEAVAAPGVRLDTLVFTGASCP